MSDLVAVVDYGLCNLDSVCRALEECGGRPVLATDPADLETADRIVLPGVGAFPDAMAALRASHMDQAMTDAVCEIGLPFLGICLGMQLMAALGHESGDTKGLGWIAGDVVRLEPTTVDPRVPHIGWNEVDPVGDQPLFDGIAPGTDFYFVHSFHLQCEPGNVAAETPYAGGLVSAVASGTIHGVQFHPEKSQTAGHHLLQNFLAI